METTPALVFADPAGLARALERWPTEAFLQAPCRLLRARDPGGKEVLFLTSDLLAGEADAGVRTLVRRGARLELDGRPAGDLLGEEGLASPLLAVPLAPWKQEPEVRGVLALCRDAAAYEDALSRCLVLGAEAMRAAPLGSGEVALLVDDPSFFLIQTWHEEGSARVFWRGEHRGLFYPWGRAHPLERRLRGFDAGDHLFLALPEGGWTRLESGGLQDVYAGLVLELEEKVERVLEPAGDLPRVEVTMRWGFRPTPAEPELWRLPGAGAPVVDDLMSRLAEAELQALQLAVLRRGEEEVFLIRRLSRGGEGRSVPPDVPGEPFHPYAGYGNLFLPADRLLEPPIRKDRFRSMLGLVPGEVVMLGVRDPDAAEAGEGMEVLRFPERAFQALPTLVDYRIAREEARLEQILRSAVFEFEALDLAPDRAPDPARSRPPRSRAGDEGKPGDPEAGGREVAAEVEVAVPEEPAPATPTPTTRSRAEPVPEAPEVAGGADPEEARLEAAALEASDPGPWAALAAYKAGAGRHREAVFAAEEALWRAGDDAGRGEAREAWSGYLGGALGGGDPGPDALLARVAEGGEGRDMAARLLALRAGGGHDAGALRDALAAAYQGLKGARLRRKARWMAWEEVLARSGDLAEEERQREEILGSLARRGLDPEDRPPFLGRYLRTRIGLEEWSEQADLPVLLDLLAEASMTIPAGPFRLEAQTLVHRTRLEAEREGGERALVDELRAMVARVDEPDLVSLSNLAGALSHLAAEDGMAVFLQVFRRIRETRESELQDRVFEHLFSNLVFAESFTGAQGVVQGSVEVLRELSPARRCRVLADVAGHLVELGAREEARELAVELLGQGEIRADPFYVERTMVALRRALGADPVPVEVWRTVGETMAASSEAFDTLYLDLVEDTGAALGEEFLGRLERGLADEADGAPYQRLVLGACRVRILAEAGDAAQGLARVEEAIPRCWDLPKIPLQARALSRYVRALAHLGNVEKGTALLARVVSEVHQRDARDLDDFYRTEILGHVARTAGDLGDPERAVGILESILDGVQARLEGGRDDAALLFDVLSTGILVLLDLAEWAAGAPLVERVEAVISARVARETGVHRGPLFFLHRGRVVCARALLYMGMEQAGTRALMDALEGFRAVSALDRPDLLKETARVLPYIDGAARREALGHMVELMRQMEDYGEYDRRCRAEVVHALASAVRPGADAFRREQNRWDALEARSIRRRVAHAHPARGA